MDDPSCSVDIDPQLARHLFETGSFLLFFDFPVGSEFGIDYSSWTTAEKFKGVKMIPPGIHFVYFSVVKLQQQSPRIGFFHNFEEKGICVKKWDAKAEDLMDYTATLDEIENFRRNLQELDQYLAPYPRQHYKTWYSLTNHISPQIILKLNPEDRGRISSQSELVSKEVQDLGESSQRIDRQHPVRQRFFDKQGLPIMYVKPGTEIRFTNLKLNDNILEPSAMNTYDHLLTKIFQSSENSADFLGEMQFAFVCFLIGHLYDAFEQWKRIVRLLCSCESSIPRNRQFFSQFINAIYFELKLTPKDFFVDIISKNNFLTVTLSHFFTNIESNVDPNDDLYKKATKFKNFLSNEYEWDFDDTTDDSKPVIVEEDD
uniref:Protein AAR2 homolog n=1 Tax=Romanomermis culicivorax TaxID=13658 RepID=A0A915JH36_ROMCU